MNRLWLRIDSESAGQFLSLPCCLLPPPSSFVLRAPRELVAPSRVECYTRAAGGIRDTDPHPVFRCTLAVTQCQSTLLLLGVVAKDLHTTVQTPFFAGSERFFAILLWRLPSVHRNELCAAARTLVSEAAGARAFQRGRAVPG